MTTFNVCISFERTQWLSMFGRRFWCGSCFLFFLFWAGGFCLPKLLVACLWLWELWWLFQDHTLSGIGLLWPAVLVASAAFQAGASIIKEFVFIDAAKRLEGKSLDIFVVNSFGSGFQALFVFLLLPFLSNLKGIPFGSLLSYLKDGAGCFFNTGAKISGCEGAHILPLLYIATNLAFNISILHLVKISSAIVSSLTVMLSVPLSVYIMSKPLPYLPGGSSLSSNFMMGSIVLVLGLLLYNIPTTSLTKQHTKTS
ncbi:PREDICTED: protein CLT2, chloroplastic-like [Camelina sativa]|uniref:Protein CLT2, chloroplastic-like n=1 Tax=Camelina sativa TaxID=90675 RepID=A0ABM1QML6_CAMSA|nr:PREDICTED: protein CLT2, chloroplastic-like [Camelina sativa]